VAFAVQHADEPAIAAAATLALAAVLEQAVTATLNFRRRTGALETGFHKDATRAGDVLKREMTFKERVERTIRIASDDEYMLDSTSMGAKLLSHLIEIRNRLLHIDDESLEVDIIVDAMGIGRAKLPIEKLKPSAWVEADTKSVLEFQSVVKAYVGWLDHPSRSSFVREAP
jgi:hypothetical protein